MLTPPLLALLRSLLDRLIPSDEWPGAVETGVEHYVFRQMAGDCAQEADSWRAGWVQIDAESQARFQKHFVTLESAQQDELIAALALGRAVTEWPRDISSAAFIDRMINLAHEGFYSDPGNCGNRDAISWRMVRFDPRMPDEKIPPIR